MNTKNLQMIINNYIDKFEFINSSEKEEFYKWQIAKSFRPMMDIALASLDECFPNKLYAVKKLTQNLIDSFTQPLNGLIEFAKKEPGTVRSMFLDLFRAAAGDVNEKQAGIMAFLRRSHELREKYYPGSFLYNDDMHSVTAYLFLYDPDHNYLYKAKECREFADHIEFYDDWRTGESMRLDVFYRMCDQVLTILKADDALMKTDANRYSIDPEGMHPDKEKHILLFDMIFCCEAYELYEGVPYTAPKTSERRLMQERKEKAARLAAELGEWLKQRTELEQARSYLRTVFSPGLAVHSRAFGKGSVVAATEKTIRVLFPESGEKDLDLKTCIINGIITVEDAAIRAKLEGYRDILSKERLIGDMISRLERELIPYTDYLD